MDCWRIRAQALPERGVGDDDKSVVDVSSGLTGLASSSQKLFPSVLEVELSRAGGYVCCCLHSLE